MYQYLKDGDNVRTDAIRRVLDGATVPNCPHNRDWVVYQEWLAAGNTPLDPQ